MRSRGAVHGDRLVVELAGGVAVARPRRFSSSPISAQLCASSSWILRSTSHSVPFRGQSSMNDHERLRARALGLEHAVEELVALCQ